jgi:glycosyltransferase involved in cell wall biosynthesis
VDTSVFRKKESTADHDRADASLFRIGYVGRFVEEKGVDVLLRAAASLSFSYRLTLVGDGPAKSQWMRFARELDIADRVKWSGAVAHSRVPECLGAMDVVVLASTTGKTWKEQFGRILIEAMACGVPVIGSSSGEIPGVIGNAGLIFKEGDAQGLALGLRRLHADAELRQALSAKGLQRVQSSFSLSRVAGQYHQLFCSLLPS